MALATAQDVSARLGRDLTTAESGQADAVIASVAGLIANAASTTTTALEALDPTPAYLHALCVEKALQAVVNPTNVAAVSEQLGSYQHSETYPRSADIGVFLSDAEQRQVRRAVSGVSFHSLTLETPYSGTVDPVTGLLA